MTGQSSESEAGSGLGQDLATGLAGLIGGKSRQLLQGRWKCMASVAKQSIGVCVTRRNVAQIEEMRDGVCPNNHAVTK